MNDLPHIMPFLWVHGEDEATYRRMVGALYDANLRAFCVEARPHDGFCREPWWRDMDIILDEAEKRGMKVWILDDRHFPTGFANGEALKAPPELRRQGLLHKVFLAEGTVTIDLTAQAHPDVTGDRYYQITDHLNNNLIPECQFDDDSWLGVSALRLDAPGGPVDLTPFVREGVLTWRAPEGRWEVQLTFLSRNIGTHRSYINMMDEASCRIQLDAVYEPHFAHYGDKFGTVIAGFFSDEPELGNNRMYKMDNPLGTEQDLPWSRELEAALRQRLGEGFPALLSLLWSNDGGPGLTAKVRYHFMDCVSRLVERDFSKQIGDWCTAHGVEYIGHVVEDNNQHARTGTSLGHYFRGLKWQTMAGLDDIGGQVEPGCEDRRKPHPLGHVDDGEFYHYALGKLGASLAALNPRMGGRTMCEVFGNYGWGEGVRLEKYLLDHFMVRGVNYFVPHAFTCSPYPEKDCPPHFYAQGNNPQYRHFGALMKYADRVTALISGGRTVTPAAVLYHAEAEWCGRAMLDQKPARVLLDNQIDFHFVPADVFAERDFYKTEISDTLTVNGNRYRALVIPYAQFITRETAEAVVTMQSRGGRVLFLEALPDGLCTGEPLPEAVRDCPVIPLEGLAETLRDLRTVTLTPASDRVRAMRYRGERELMYLFNEGLEPYRGAVTLPDGDWCIYDAWQDRYQAADIREGRLTVDLAPSRALLLVAGPAPAPLYLPAPRGERVPLTSFTRSVCRAIDYPAFGPGEAVTVPEDYAGTDPGFSGFIRYETVFDCPARTLEIVDAGEAVEVLLNGESLGIQVAAPFVYDLRGHVRQGGNRLTVEAATTLERENNGRDPASTGLMGDVSLYL